MKEKLTQIYEVVADKALERINGAGIDDYALELIRTAQSLYETMIHKNQPVIATAIDASDDCKYTSRPIEDSPQAQELKKQMNRVGTSAFSC
ncbi:MAG: hypothetical protein HFI70_11235 [Lachnospiraceae bacterium]|nr:hypothetical protein [Lachnospiraceae bacterium]